MLINLIRIHLLNSVFITFVRVVFKWRLQNKNVYVNLSWHKGSAGLGSIEARKEPGKQNPPLFHVKHWLTLASFFLSLLSFSSWLLLFPLPSSLSLSVHARICGDQLLWWDQWMFLPAMPEWGHLHWPDQYLQMLLSQGNPRSADPTHTPPHHSASPSSSPCLHASLIRA